MTSYQIAGWTRAVIGGLISFAAHTLFLTFFAAPGTRVPWHVTFECSKRWQLKQRKFEIYGFTVKFLACRREKEDTKQIAVSGGKGKIEGRQDPWVPRNGTPVLI
ncbi:hypothetical protein AVEN_18827-1 [Araneus ventricosus]|uniref:Uncharacterized protein n=1 Tax=Araneus ventricosus TaxID=182803 RepID=A0A4Y2T4W5_ARAVE|nr:hypothetical protein AVEN_18827-1 [Araneus ventricosus]